jgi:hypothetical protein
LVDGPCLSGIGNGNVIHTRKKLVANEAIVFYCVLFVIYFLLTNDAVKVWGPGKLVGPSPCLHAQKVYYCYVTNQRTNLGAALTTDDVILALSTGAPHYETIITQFIISNWV